MCGRLFKKSHLKILLLLILILITVESTFQVKWKYNADDIIEICFILNRKSWIEVGLGKRMRNVDMLTVNIIDNKAEIIDLLSVEYDTHPTDTQQDLISYSIGDSTVKIRIKKKIKQRRFFIRYGIDKRIFLYLELSTSSALVMEDHGHNFQEFFITLNEIGDKLISYSEILMFIVVIFNLIF